MSKLIKQLSFCFLFFLSLEAMGEALGQAQRASISNSFNNLNPTKSIGGCPPANTCATVTENLIDYEKSDKFVGFAFLKSSYNSCRAGLDRIPEGFNSKDQMLAHYEKTQGADLGPQIQSKMRQCLSNDLKLAQDQISKYYYHFGQMKDVQNENLRQLAAIDQAIGGANSPRLNCDKILIESSKKLCHEMQACPVAADATLPALAEATSATKKSLAELDHQLKIWNSKLSFATSIYNHVPHDPHEAKYSPEMKEAGERVQLLEFQISLEKSHIPWAEGSDYKKAIKNGKSEAEAIKAQFKTDRAKIAEENSSLDHVQGCLLGGGPHCEVSDIGDQLLGLPVPNDVFRPEKGEDRFKVRSAYLYQSFNSCVQAQTNDRDHTARKIYSAEVGAAISLAFIPALAWLAPASLESATVGEVLLNARSAKILGQIKELKAIESFGAINTASTVGGAGEGIVSAVHECLKKPTEDPAKRVPASSKQGPICENIGVGAATKAVKDYDRCIEKSIGAGVAATMPFVPTANIINAGKEWLGIGTPIGPTTQVGSAATSASSFSRETSAAVAVTEKSVAASTQSFQSIEELQQVVPGRLATFTSSGGYQETSQIIRYDAEMAKGSGLSVDEVVALRKNFSDTIPTTGETGVFKLGQTLEIDPKSNLVGAYSDFSKKLASGKSLTGQDFLDVRSKAYELRSVKDGQDLVSIPTQMKGKSTALVESEISPYAQERLKHYGIDFKLEPGKTKIFYPESSRGPPLDQLAAEVNRMIAAGHPPERIAAFVTQDLLILHPFKDGNGRTARLIGQAIYKQLSGRDIVFPRQFHSELNYSLDQLTASIRSPTSTHLPPAPNYHQIVESAYSDSKLVPEIIDPKKIASSAPKSDVAFPAKFTDFNKQPIIYSELPKDIRTNQQTLYYGRPGGNSVSEAEQEALKLIKFGRGSQEANPSLDVNAHVNGSIFEKRKSGFFSTSESIRVATDFAKKSTVKKEFGVVYLIDPRDAEVLNLYQLKGGVPSEREVLFGPRLNPARIEAAVIVENKSGKIIKILKNPNYESPE